MGASPFKRVTRSLSALALGTFVAVAPWAATAAHAAVTSANFSGSQLQVVADAGSDDIALRHDGAGAIQLLDHGVPVAITNGPATLTTTDLINIQTGGGDDRVTLDESNGVFAPGVTSEATGTSEIEIFMNFGTGTTVLRILGQDGAADSMDGSTGQMNVNGDDDGDVFANPDRFELDGLGGGDTITGSSGSCAVILVPYTINGGMGDDHVTGGYDADVVSGGPGTDTVEGSACSSPSGDQADQLYGGPGNDTISGQVGNDTIQGGGGADTIDGGPNADLIRGGAQGDTITGGESSDVMIGGFGDDTLHGTDTDGGNILDGKAGTDTCDAGAGDTVRHCEG